MSRLESSSIGMYSKRSCLPLLSSTVIHQNEFPSSFTNTHGFQPLHHDDRQHNLRFSFNINNHEHPPLHLSNCFIHHNSHVSNTDTSGNNTLLGRQRLPLYRSNHRRRNRWHRCPSLPPQLHLHPTHPPKEIMPRHCITSTFCQYYHHHHHHHHHHFINHSSQLTRIREE